MGPTFAIDFVWLGVYMSKSLTLGVEILVYPVDPKDGRFLGPVSAS